MKAKIRKKAVFALFLFLLLTACIGKGSSSAKKLEYEVGMSVNEFLAKNNLDMKDAKIEKKDGVELIIFDFENDNKADVIILKNSPQPFDSIVVYDYEKGIAYIFPVGKKSGTIITPPETAQITQ